MSSWPDPINWRETNETRRSESLNTWAGTFVREKGGSLTPSKNATINEELKYVCLVIACAQILKWKNRNSLIQPNVCLKQLSDNYQLAGNRKATSFVTVSGLSMNKANFYCKKNWLICKMQRWFSFACLPLERPPAKRFGRLFSGFSVYLFKKKSMKL